MLGVFLVCVLCIWIIVTNKDFVFQQPAFIIQITIKCTLCRKSLKISLQKVLCLCTCHMYVCKTWQNFHTFLATLCIYIKFYSIFLFICCVYTPLEETNGPYTYIGVHTNVLYLISYTRIYVHCWLLLFDYVHENVTNEVSV